jgi:hypothetical protein
MVLGDILFNLKLWSELKNPEDVALHNAALALMARMGIRYIVNPKDAKRLRFEIEYPESEEISETPRDVQRG